MGKIINLKKHIGSADMFIEDLEEEKYQKLLNALKAYRLVEDKYTLDDVLKNFGLRVDRITNEKTK